MPNKHSHSPVRIYSDSIFCQLGFICNTKMLYLQWLILRAGGPAIWTTLRPVLFCYYLCFGCKTSKIPSGECRGVKVESLTENPVKYQSNSWRAKISVRRTFEYYYCLIQNLSQTALFSLYITFKNKNKSLIQSAKNWEPIRQRSINKKPRIHL